MKILIAASALCLGACAMPSTTGTAEQRVSIDGRTYQIGQLTNSTWIATPRGIGKPLAITPSSRSALLDAIAQTSGCNVTDSDLSRQGLQLDAQVECGSNLDPQSASRK